MTTLELEVDGWKLKMCRKLCVMELVCGKLMVNAVGEAGRKYMYAKIRLPEPLSRLKLTKVGTVG